MTTKNEKRLLRDSLKHEKKREDERKINRIMVVFGCALGLLLAFLVFNSVFPVPQKLFQIVFIAVIGFSFLYLVFHIYSRFFFWEALEILMLTGFLYATKSLYVLARIFPTNHNGLERVMLFAAAAACLIVIAVAAIRKEKHAVLFITNGVLIAGVAFSFILAASWVIIALLVFLMALAVYYTICLI